MNPNDAIRDAILRHLYTVHQRAASPRSAAIKVSDLRKALRPLGYKQHEVGSNLDYLVQKGWVRAAVEERKFQTPGGTTQSSPQYRYKISDVGIDKLEAASVYQRPAGIPGGINIVNIDGVTVVGDGNVVNTRFTEVARAVAELRAAVLRSDQIPDREKLDVVADIDALQSQLQKPEPDRVILRSLWEGIEHVATLGGFVELAQKTAELLAPLIA